MHGIVVERNDGTVRISLSGEFDAFALPGLRRALDNVPGGASRVDLSGVTFLDLRTTRELVVRSVIDALDIENPPPAVLASFRALGLGDGTPAWNDPKEPPVFSGT